MSLLDIVRCLFGKHDWWPKQVIFGGTTFERCGRCGQVRIKRGIV